MPTLSQVTAALITALTASTITAAPVPKDAERKVAVAYVHATDKKGAEAFKKLLDAEGFTVDLVAAGGAAKADFSKYGLVLIGSDAERVVWKNIAPLVEKSGKPVLGLGEGGYTFFGRDGLKLGIGSPHGAHAKDGAECKVVPVEAEKSPLWTAAAIPGGKPVPLSKSSGWVGIYLPKPPEDVVLLGRSEASANHYTIVRQGDRFVLWGYTGGPDDMTADGRKLFVAACRYTANLTRAKGKD